MHPFVDAVNLRFESSSGEVVLEADLLHLMEGVYESSRGKDDVRDCVRPFQAWLQRNLNVMVAPSQAYVIYRRAADEYEGFKKKLENGSTSPMPSDSIRDSSISE